MARSRNIKPGFFINNELAEIEPLGRILFIGLWTIADREGRLKDIPRKIKVQVLPYDNCNVDKLLNSLAAAGFIVRYKVDGCKCIQINNFNKHQNPHIREVESELPPPPEDKEAPDKNGANTGQELDEHRTSPADSLNPHTDSLNPHRSPEHLFGELWEIYPRKRGRGQVSDAQKKRLYDIGWERMKKCVRAYIRDMEREGRPPDKYQYGSTFFNSGYVDYLDQDKPEATGSADKKRERPKVVIVGTLDDMKKAVPT